MNQNAAHIHLTNGLGDKLLDLIGFYIICKYLNYKPYVKFYNDGQYVWGNNHYDERLFHYGDFSIYQESCPFYIESPNPSTSLCPYRVYIHLKHFFPNITFEQISNDFELHAKELIKPSEIIIKNMPNGIENAYGIHLRKTDKLNDYGDIRHENRTNEFNIIIDKLLDDVREIISREPEPTFLIVSEDFVWKNEIKEKILDIDKKVIFIEPDYTNTDNYSNYQSVMDMFCLSKCKEILQGVKYSTFSILAALIGNGKLRNYSNFIESGHLCLIYSWNSVVEINNKKNLEIETHERITYDVRYLNTNIDKIERGGGVI